MKCAGRPVQIQRNVLRATHIEAGADTGEDVGTNSVTSNTLTQMTHRNADTNTVQAQTQAQVQRASPNPNASGDADASAEANANAR